MVYFEQQIVSRIPAYRASKTDYSSECSEIIFGFTDSLVSSWDSQLSMHRILVRDSLVELEESCKMSLQLQKSASIQQKTSLGQV